MLPDLGDSILERISKVCCARGASTRPSIASFDTELSRRFAIRAGKDLHAAKALWDLSLKRSTELQTETWIDVSALVLATCKLPEYNDADFSTVPKRVLERALWFVRNGSQAAIHSFEFFRVRLERSVEQRFITAFILFNLAHRQDAMFVLTPSQNSELGKFYFLRFSVSFLTFSIFLTFRKTRL